MLTILTSEGPTGKGEASIEEAYSGPLGRHGDRPWVALCMVASLDGSTVLDGASGGLSSDNDVEVLLQLRSVADVIVVGSGTASGEGYGPPKKQGQRIGVVTGSGRIDADSELFRSGAGFVITSEATEIADGIDVIRAGRDSVDLREAIGRLGEVHDHPGVVQAEGGPGLNGSLLGGDLIDELNVTMSPLMIGGDGPRLTRDAADVSHRFDLVQLARDEQSFVFTRWIRRR